MGKGDHLKALLYKEWILAKRNRKRKICETLFPLIIFISLLTMREQFKIETHDKLEYIMEKPSYAYSYSLDNSTLGLQADLSYQQQRLISEKALIGVVVTDDDKQLGKDFITFLSIKGFQESTIKDFASEEKLTDYATDPDKYYKDDKNTPEVLKVGVRIEQDENTNSYSYKIYTSQNIWPVKDDYYDKHNREPKEDEYKKIRESLYPMMEFLIGNFLGRRANKDINIKMGFSPMKTFEYKSDPMILSAATLFPLLFVFSYLLIINSFTNKVVQEKENKMRDQMKMMGLKDFTYWMSLFIAFMIQALINTILLTIVTCVFLTTKTNFMLVFFYILCFGFTVFPLAMFITTLFKTQNLARILGMLIFYLPFILIISFTNKAGISTGVKLVTSIIPGNALGYGLLILLERERIGTEFGFGDCNWEFWNYSLTYGFISFIVDFFIYLIVAMYLDNILPTAGGIRKSPLYFLKPSYWRGYTASTGTQGLQAEYNENFEGVSATLQEQETGGQTLKIRKLMKVFKDKVAVGGVDLDCYKGQILCLLGHNGAGKTTMISMITGVLSITGGEASMQGLDIKGSMAKIRKSLGVCTQFDCLYDLLTVQEHMTVFGKFKGINTSLANNPQVTTLIQDIGLMPKRNTLVKELSGGQKRKLSVGLSLLGNNDLVILDEPSSGLDTTARRNMWEVLKRAKQDKIIILTTHYMDEADFLGDRIAIMNQGIIQCCGSALFLKNKFGIGYNLTIAKEDKKVPSEPISNLVLSQLDQSEIKTDAGKELSFRIPFAASPKFEEFFNLMENEKQNLGVNSYGISITTLEDVFLRVGAVGSIEELNEDTEARHSFKKVRKSSGTEEPKEDMYSIGDKSTDDFMDQFIAILKKKVLLTFRMPIMFFVLIMFPVGMYVGGLAFSLIGSGAPQTHTYELSNLPLPVPIFVNSYVDYLTWPKDQITTTLVIPTTQIENIYYYSKESNDTLVAFDNQSFEKESKDQERRGAFYAIKQFSDEGDKVFEVVTFCNLLAPESILILSNAVLRNILSTLKIQIKSAENVNIKVYEKDTGQVLEMVKSMLLGIYIALGFGMLAGYAATVIVAERIKGQKHQQLISGISLKAYWACNIITDALIIYIPMIIMISITPVFGISIPYYWVPLILLPLCLPIFTYPISFLINNADNAFMVVYVSSGFLTMIFVVAVVVLKAFQNTYTIALIIQYIFMPFIPTFSCITCLTDIAMRKVCAYYRTGDYSSYMNPPHPMSWNVGGKNLFFMFVAFFIYLGVVIIIENYRNKKKIKSFAHLQEVAEADVLKDKDVLNEEQRIDLAAPIDMAVFAQNLIKSYDGKKIAVNKLSFGVDFGDIFALLGVNGAGKTTTFKMITTDVTPNTGRVFVGGLDVNSSQFGKARKMMGYCPQFDALFDLLTVREHLDFYSRIKGIIRPKRLDMIDGIIKDLDLEQYANKKVNELSGGNKRKLSVGLAILGNPPIILLDEPSTGIDPKARRFMWSVVGKIATQWKKSAVIITTHSMEEAEALSSKLGIMVHGIFRCFGSPQDIKNTYGSGYEIEIKITNPVISQITAKRDQLGFAEGHMVSGNEALRGILGGLISEVSERGEASNLHNQMVAHGGVNIDNVITFILIKQTATSVLAHLEQQLGEIRILQNYLTYFKFRAVNEDISIGLLFGVVERIKLVFPVSEYSVSQTSLEQIFHYFSKLGEEEEEGEGGERKSSLIYKPPAITKEAPKIGSIQKAKPSNYTSQDMLELAPMSSAGETPE